jgi:hypothetical protein
MMPPPADPSPLRRNTVAKVVRLNWMIEHLKTHPIMKPLLLHDVAGQLTTQTGDTRLQALEFHPEITDVPCLLSIGIDRLPVYTGNTKWQIVENKEQMAKLLGIDEQYVVVKDDVDWNYSLLEWIEFAMPETSNHLHDEQRRYQMFVDYYNKYVNAAGFPPAIDKNWLTNGRTWDY